MNDQSSPVGPGHDSRSFIRDRLRVTAVPLIPEIRLYTAHPASGLWRLPAKGDGVEAPPYWVYQWAGGLALARYLLDRPETVAGLRVLDLGAGSGIVGIAAAMSGASEVIAAEIDSNAHAALALNAAENGVALTTVCDDLTAGPPPLVDIVAVGDLFYESQLAEKVTAFLDRCLAAGIKVLIGDPYRAYLPFQRLRLLAEYKTPDVGGIRDAPATSSAVFALEPADA